MGSCGPMGRRALCCSTRWLPKRAKAREGTLRLALQRRLDLGLDEADDAITRVKNVRFRFVLGQRLPDRSGL